MSEKVVHTQTKINAKHLSAEPTGSMDRKNKTPRGKAYQKHLDNLNLLNSLVTFAISSGSCHDVPALLNAYLANEVAADQNGVPESLEIPNLNESTVINHFKPKLETAYSYGLGAKQLGDAVTEGVSETANVQKSDCFNRFMMSYSRNFMRTIVMLRNRVLLN